MSKAAHFAMWVGGEYYPHIEDFVAEASVRGASKRLPYIPEGLVVGQSRVYVAHAQRMARMEADPIIGQLKKEWRNRLLAWARQIKRAGLSLGEVIEQRVKHRTHYDEACIITNLVRKKHPGMLDANILLAGINFIRKGDDRVVFGYFMVDQIEFIMPPDEHIPEKIKKLVEEGHVKPVPYSQVQMEPDRGCGRRRPGGLYAVSYFVDEQGMDELRSDARDADAMGSFTLFDKPILAPFGFFRGIKKMTDKMVKVLDA